MELPGAPATYALIIANLVASIYGLSFDRGFVGSFAFNVGALAKAKQHYRVFTSSFLHGDYFHLLFNMMTLWFFGPQVERLLGTDGFLVVYFGAVLASGIVSFYVNRKNYAYTSLGASDGVSGVVLSFCLFYPLAPIYFFLIPIGIPAILYGVFYILISANMMGRFGGKTAHEAHLAGAIAGVVLTVLMRPDVITYIFG
ncbi:rhomboid family intramembrane serine protease [Hyphococcus luteus]|uniref:Rhomboid family intramembrane serine protease n=1 Tax=Hyphococcus luteus TaxID=2058213 RepID=A0A2S7JZ44_9PROT|nr:rhomboid family intramembrane serine protease [Marinicaulis flavus]PQA85527.1 rhomboid family intramembrane serine protease [Marinicaulis flavus]